MAEPTKPVVKRTRTRRQPENVLGAPSFARAKNPVKTGAKLPSEKLLTGKQAAFVRWYTTPGETLYNGTRSAEKAGYRGSDNALHVQAYENLRKPHVVKAVQAELRRQYSAADLSIERVLRDVELVRLLAIREGRYQAALRASDMMGKYLKMWTQKIEHLHTIEDASTDELLALLGDLVKKIDGLDLTRLVAGDGAEAGSVPAAARAPTTH